MTVERLLAACLPIFKSVGNEKGLVTFWPKNAKPPNCLDHNKVSYTFVTPQPTCLDRLFTAGITGVVGHFLTDVEGSHNQFSLVVVPGKDIIENLPINSPQALHTEYRYIHRAQQYLMPGGYLVFQISKSKLIQNKNWAKWLLQYYDFRVYDFENSLVFIGSLRSKRSPVSPSQLVSFINSLNIARLPSLPEHPILKLPSVSEKQNKHYFRSSFFNPLTVDAYIKTLGSEKGKIKHDLEGLGRVPLKPIFKVRTKHLGSLIASGVLGTIRVKSPITNDLCVIRGIIKRNLFIGSSGSQSKGNESEGDHEIDIEDNLYLSTLDSSIVILNVNKKTKQVIDLEKDGAAVAEFLEEWAGTLVDYVENNYPVLYDPMESPYYKTFHPFLINSIDRPLRTSENFSNTYEPALTTHQKHITAAGLLTLLGRHAFSDRKGSFDGYNSFFLQGEKRVGKSIMGAKILEGLVLEFSHRHKLRLGYPGWPVSAVVTVPSNIDQFCKEIKKASKLLEPIIVDNIGQLYATLALAKTSPKPIVMVIPISMLSRSQKIEPVALSATQYLLGKVKNYKKGVTPLFCSNCGAVAAENWFNKKGKHFQKILRKKDLSKSRTPFRGKFCESCDSPFWTETNPSINGNRKSTISEWFSRNQTKTQLGPSDEKQEEFSPNSFIGSTNNKNKSYQYNLAFVMKNAFRKARVKPLAVLFDEVHQGKAGESTRGFALGWFASVFDKTIALSGTTYGGVPSSIFHLLYRLVPAFRSMFDIDEVNKFIKQYGNWMRLKKEDRWGRIIERPGISPTLMTGLLINRMLFVTRKDAGLPEPTRTDIPVFVELSKDEQACIDKKELDIHAKVTLEEAASEKRVSVSIKDLWSLRTHPIGFHLVENANYSPAWSCPICMGLPTPIGFCEHDWDITPPVYDHQYVSSREKALLDVIHQEVRVDKRPCLLYIVNSGSKFRIDLRLENLLVANGYMVFNAKKERPRNVQKSIISAVFQGADVVIVNPEKVANGSDLICTPTIINYQASYKSQMMNQAASRSEGPAQKQDVRVYWMVASKTVEEVVLSRAIEHIVAQEFVAGKSVSGMDAVLEAIGHEQAPEELIANYIELSAKGKKETYAGLEAIFEKLNTLREMNRGNENYEKRPRRSKTDDYVPKKRNELKRATQLNLFSSQ